MLDPDLFQRLTPLLPALMAVKNRFFDNPSISQKKDELKQQREIFIENNPPLQTIKFDVIDIDCGGVCDNQDDQKRMHEMYKSIIEIYQKQTIEFAKLLDLSLKKIHELESMVQEVYQQRNNN